MKCFPLEFGHKVGEKVTLHPLKWLRGAWETLSEILGVLQTLLVLFCGLWANKRSSCSTLCPKLQDQNKQTGVQRDLIAMWSCSFPPPHCLSAVYSLFTGTREAKQTCQHFKGSFTEQGQVSQSPLHKCNPLQETAQCSCQCCYLFLCGAIWMELSFADLAQARWKNTQKNPQKTPNTLRSWLLWHCSIVKEELSILSKISDLT